jgi:tRNA threonylcarbamoyladenosine biosynthesis protein TsaE
VNFPFSTIANDEKETEIIAAKFAKEIKGGRVIVLNGNLGSGKTFFIKKVLQTFQINYANSPSFGIVNEYEGSIKVYHFDFFRLVKINELHDIGWQDYLNDTDALIFIEWGESLKEALPDRRIEILLTILGDSKRRFDFYKYE